MHKQKQLEAIKASEKNEPVSEQVKQARAIFEEVFGIKYKKV